ncbi:hypothetical protein KAR91_87575, partial [Candidatus Pacearchaeota archaeon]|nr:hypothetical protein [Candidatus Pacearchaeota archaeon]
VCPKCRRKMPKTEIIMTRWEDGFRAIVGSCTICKQFPCAHGTPDVVLVSAAKLSKIRRMQGHLLELGCRGWTDIMIQKVLEGDPNPEVPSMESVRAWRQVEEQREIKRDKERLQLLIKPQEKCTK